MDAERAAKRARQACLNCRRKKTRCSGETPICSFCARLNQPCVWETDRERASLHRHSFFNTPDSALAARVALLESKLNLLGGKPTSDASIASVGHETADTVTTNYQSTLPGSGLDTSSTYAPFSSLPSKAVLADLIENYFAYCHNQPYAFFHEATFRERFEQDTLQMSLLFAVAATACRFSNDPLFRDQHSLANTFYSSASWTQIFQQSFSYEDDLDITVVQVMSMLAVTEFTAGHPRQGWVKVALAVRFAQALHLDEEPDIGLPAWEREEQRRTFWSVYLLDRLVSLGPNRPPTFSDSDCTVHLPSPDEAFRTGQEALTMPTLEAVVDDSRVMHYANLGHFALTVLMACALGKIIRFCLKRSCVDKYPPWDWRSVYYKIHSMLLQHESHSILAYASLEEFLQSQLTIGASMNQQQAGHLVYSQALFHLNHCLLNHPFVLYHLFRRNSILVPLSFAREALERSRTHAGQLLDHIHEAQSCGRRAESSWYGYCVVVSAVIFRLFEQHRDQSVVALARKRVSMALEYLERQPVRWVFHPMMVSPLSEVRLTLTTPR